MSNFRCRFHGELDNTNAWVHKGKVICSQCGMLGEQVVQTGPVDRARIGDFL